MGVLEYIGYKAVLIIYQIIIEYSEKRKELGKNRGKEKRQWIRKEGKKQIISLSPRY